MDPSYKCYCGPFWMPKFMRRWLSVPFNASCRLHDLHYDQKIGRYEADRRFLANMMRLVEKKHQGIPRIFWRIVARLFYYAVRLGGWISYR